MNVLVTGSAGYIGSVLCPYLVAAGHDVVGLDTGYYDGCDFGPHDGEVRRIDLDVRDVRPEHLVGFDAVVHLAALSNDPLGDLRLELTHEINHFGTARWPARPRRRRPPIRLRLLLCPVRRLGRRRTARRGRAVRPLTAYAESKVTGRGRPRGAQRRRVHHVAMRNATVYGVSPRLRLDVVLNNLAAWSHVTGRIRLLSDGSSWRPLLHVRDLAKVTAVMIRAPASLISGRAFNIGSAPQNYVVRDLAEILADVTGCDVELADHASPDPRSYRVDFSALGRAFPDLVLDWDARKGAQELADAYCAHNLTAAGFEGRAYVRLRQLRHLLDERPWTGTCAGRAAEMRFMETALEGVLIVELEQHVDERGSSRERGRARKWRPPASRASSRSAASRGIPARGR